MDRSDIPQDLGGPGGQIAGSVACRPLRLLHPRPDVGGEHGQQRNDQDDGEGHLEVDEKQDHHDSEQAKGLWDDDREPRHHGVLHPGDVGGQAVRKVSRSIPVVKPQRDVLEPFEGRYPYRSSHAFGGRPRQIRREVVEDPSEGDDRDARAERRGGQADRRHPAERM